MRVLSAGLALTLFASACALDVRRQPTVAVPGMGQPHVASAPPVAAPSPEQPVDQASDDVAAVSLAPSAPARPPVATPAARFPSTPASGGVAGLQGVAAERAGLRDGDAYVLGPGDEVSITVFGLDEMTRKVRIGQSGDIQLPLIGTVEAAGRSQADLAKAIADKLEQDYLQDPQVDVFVEQYRSQQVAVTGAVANPGLFPLTKDRYTILDMISEAGGLTKDAGGFIEFIPVRGGKRSKAFDVARHSGDLAPNLAGQGIQIDLNELMRASSASTTNLTVVAGDVIFVPEAGTFAIEGWVEKPGTFPLSRGMTLLAALSTGGGPQFPAALGSIELLRAGPTSAEVRKVEVVDVDAIRDGERPDVPLRAGDVVRVPANPLLVPPWVVYSLLRDFIRLGASVPVGV